MRKQLLIILGFSVLFPIFTIGEESVSSDIIPYSLLSSTPDLEAGIDKLAIELKNNPVDPKPQANVCTLQPIPIPPVISVDPFTCELSKQFKQIQLQDVEDRSKAGCPWNPLHLRDQEDHYKRIVQVCAAAGL